eukprot:m.1016516 g.1016516  ORF g.1016516 m.1016516 type:complete len:351 (+) comp24079_c0_seq27:1203-2255(+)
MYWSPSWAQKLVLEHASIALQCRLNARLPGRDASACTVPLDVGLSGYSWGARQRTRTGDCRRVPKCQCQLHGNSLGGREEHCVTRCCRHPCYELCRGIGQHGTPTRRRHSGHEWEVHWPHKPHAWCHSERVWVGAVGRDGDGRMRGVGVRQRKPHQGHRGLRVAADVVVDVEKRVSMATRSYLPPKGRGRGGGASLGGCHVSAPVVQEQVQPSHHVVVPARLSKFPQRREEVVRLGRHGILCARGLKTRLLKRRVRGVAVVRVQQRVGVVASVVHVIPQEIDAIAVEHQMHRRHVCGLQEYPVVVRAGHATSNLDIQPWVPRRYRVCQCAGRVRSKRVLAGTAVVLVHAF